MNYPYKCYSCNADKTVTASISVGPPPQVQCECGVEMQRVWTMPMVICNADPDYIKPEDRVFDATDRRSEYTKEGAFQEHIDERRKLVRQAGHNPKTMRMTHSVPADLFHGKIRATGDKNYWDDPSNLKRHTSCKVD